MPSNQESEAPLLSLAEEQGRLTKSRIRRAAMEVVARQGFDATVDEIAKVSGVSPRTIFRHYATQGALIFATVQDMFEAVGQRPIAGMSEPADDLDGWLDVMAVTVHTRNAQIIGNAFWDLHGPKIEESDTLAPVAAFRRSSRLTGVHHLAKVAWREAGGEGKPPKALVSAFALNLSTFATQSLMIDFDETPADIGTLTADILKTLLRRAVEAQRST
jgi:AcrR family transcriptional regulator